MRAQILLVYTLIVFKHTVNYLSRHRPCTIDNDDPDFTHPRKKFFKENFYIVSNQ